MRMRKKGWYLGIDITKYEYQYEQKYKNFM